MSSACPACGAPLTGVEAVCPNCSNPLRAGSDTEATPPAVHLTPDIGIKVFDEPYPAFGVNAGHFLPGREVVQVVAMRGTWVQVAHNGAVAGWVDGRGLVPSIGGMSANPAQTLPGARHLWPGVTAPASGSQALTVSLESIVGALGALSIVVGALIDWAQSIVSVSSFKVPLQFLFDPKTTSHDPKLGLVLLPIGLLGVLASFLPGARWWRVLLGFVAVMAAVLYCAQIAANIPDAANISLTDIIGAGPWVTGIGGVVLALSPLLRAKFAGAT